MFDPPRFRRCATTERRRLARRGRRSSRRALRRRCERRYAAARDEAMAFLVESVWIEAEAAVREIAVTPRQVRREFARQTRLAFETEREYRRFLRATGLREAELHYRVRLDLLQQRVTREVTDSARPVTAAEVDRYYARHRRDFRGMPRAKTRREIRNLLRARRQQRAVALFVDDFHSRYRAITVCADGYVVAECGERAGATPR